jgi:hypothetical protein
MQIARQANHVQQHCCLRADHLKLLVVSLSIAVAFSCCTTAHMTCAWLRQCIEFATAAAAAAAAAADGAKITLLYAAVVPAGMLPVTWLPCCNRRSYCTA